LEALQRTWFRIWDSITGIFGGSIWIKSIFTLLCLYLLIALGLGFYWSNEPDEIDVSQYSQTQAGQTPVVGSGTTGALIFITSTLLDKPGGYISNDRTPPGIWLDNIKRWEFGVLVQARDLSRALREDFSRSQSQSTEEPNLAKAEPLISFNNNSWVFPATESEYRKSLDLTQVYLSRLQDPNQKDAQFYARADNLNAWLKNVSTRLGSLSQRLSASVGQKRLNTDLSGNSEAVTSTPVDNDTEIKTSWFKIDDVFYEARGTAWALIHILKGIEQDFGPTLDKKNARVSLRQIIRELEATQNTIWSPVILNGTEFGFLANHSLVMASYISRANAAIIDLRELLAQG
jgi:hypothetical protein